MTLTIYKNFLSKIIAILNLINLTILMIPLYAAIAISVPDLVDFFIHVFYINIENLKQKFLLFLINRFFVIK